jgi:hypothetical protein
VRKHSVFCPFLKSSPEEEAWVLVEIAQRFPRRGGRVLGVHGAGSPSKVARSRLTLPAQRVDATPELTEAGYDATTMKAIAVRARACIGAACQYFPNKEALLRALREQYAIEMEKRWTSFEETTAGWSVREGSKASSI